MPDVTSDAGAVLASPNTNEADPGGIANANSAPYATAPPAPDISNFPAGRTVDERRAASGIQAKSPQQAAQEAVAADVGHHALFGKAVKNLVHSLQGTQTSYQANPQTGRIEETTVPNKPGQFFRNLLSGMLIGAAAGSQRPTDREGMPTGGGGFAGGFGRGVAAQIGNRQQQDQQQYARAQQDLKNQEERERLNSEVQWHSAMVAHENVATADLLHNMHASDEKAHRDHNAAARAYEKSLIDSGALPAKLSIGGKLVDTIDGNSFVAAYTKDPSIAKAPDGYERHFISTTDLSELHFDGSHWTDDSGQPVNIGQNITIKAYDLPTATFKTPRQVSGKQINAARRQTIVDDNSTYSISPEGMSGIYTVGSKEAAEDARTAHERSLTVKDLQEVAKAKLDTKQSQLYGEALNEYNQVGGDFSKLSPKSQVVLSESTTKLITSLTGVARAQLNAGDEDGAKETMRSINQLSQLVPKAFQQKQDASTLPKPQKPGQTVTNDVVDAYLKYEHTSNPNRTEKEIQEAAKQDVIKAGWKVPGAPNPRPTPSPFVAAPSTGNTGVPGQDQLPADARR